MISRGWMGCGEGFGSLGSVEVHSGGQGKLARCGGDKWGCGMGVSFRRGLCMYCVWGAASCRRQNSGGMLGCAPCGRSCRHVLRGKSSSGAMGAKVVLLICHSGHDVFFLPLLYSLACHVFTLFMFINCAAIIWPLHFIVTYCTISGRAELIQLQFAACKTGSDKNCWNGLSNHA